MMMGLRRLGVAAVVIGGLTVGTSAASAKPAPAPGRWTGVVYNTSSKVRSTFTFTVRRNVVSKWTARGIGCYDAGAGSYQTTTLTFPRVAVRGGRLHKVVVHRAFRITDTLNGRFTGRRRAAGSVSQDGGLGACVLGYSWVAKRGSRAPAVPAPPKPAACSLGAPCDATDGLRFQVDEVDTTLESNQDPANPWNTPDLTLSGGGALVVLTATNRSSSAITFTVPGEFTVLDGTGGHDQGRSEGGFPLSLGDGKPLPADACDENDNVTLAPGETSSPLSMCFAVPTSADHGLRLLFDYPSTMASIPLN